MDSDGPDCVDAIGLQNIEESRPSDSSTAVITLMIARINYAHSN